MENRIRELERQLGRKTIEAETLREALGGSRTKAGLACRVTEDGRLPMKAVADTLGVSPSNLHERASGRTKPHRRYHNAQDAALLPLIERLVSEYLQIKTIQPIDIDAGIIGYQAVSIHEI